MKHLSGYMRLPDSSYKKNNYGKVFYDTACAIKLEGAMVELGVLNGYSTLHIAKGILKAGTDMTLDCYDLFEDYPYKHSNRLDVEKILKKEGLASIVSLNKRNAFEVYKNYEDNSVIFLCVDLSNTGEILRKIIKQWTPKMKIGGVILFEGGTKERDEVEWVVKYKKTPIVPEMENNKTIKKHYARTTYKPFPALTALIKKEC